MIHELIESEFRNEWYRTIGKNEISKAILEDVIARYNEHHRHYHDLSHIWMCIEEQKALKLEQSDSLKLYLSSAFHDIVYSTRQDDKWNVLFSADYGRVKATVLGLDKKIAEEVHDQVIVTSHRTPPRTLLEQYRVDLDLVIFGKEAETFGEYNQNIRKEYLWIPEQTYREKRLVVLTHFASKEHIYYTGHFRRLYEGKARHNLRKEIERMCSLQTTSKNMLVLN